MPEAIAIPKMTAMQRLALAQTSLDALKKETKKWEQEYSLALGDVLHVAQFQPNSFLDAIKRKGDSHREENLLLIRSPTERRTVLMDKFAAAFPDLMKSVCKVELKKADALVGKQTMDAFVEKTTTYRYEVVDISLPENGGI